MTPLDIGSFVPMFGGRRPKGAVVGTTLGLSIALLVAPLSVGPALAGGRAVIVPPSVVQSQWRSPDALTKDALPRHDVLRDRAVAAVEAFDAYMETRSPLDSSRYLRALASVVGIVAARTSVSRADMLFAWRNASLRHQQAILVGLTTLGTGYLFGSDNPKKGLDCSGLVAYAWGAAGVTLPMKSDRQVDMGRIVPRDKAKAGDIVGYPGHTMIYLGIGDIVLHSARPNLGVRVGEINWKEATNVRFSNPEPGL